MPHGGKRQEEEAIGRNVNFCKAYNLPTSVRCANCGDDAWTGLEDYDVDLRNPWQDDGTIAVSIECQECGHKQTYRWKVIIRCEEIGR